MVKIVNSKTSKHSKIGLLCLNQSIKIVKCKIYKLYKERNKRWK